MWMWYVYVYVVLVLLLFFHQFQVNPTARADLQALVQCQPQVRVCSWPCAQNM